MGLAFRNLDQRTRELMLEELELDMASNTLYLSDRLNPYGRNVFPRLLEHAFSTGDDTTLANDLRHGCFNLTFQRRKPKGGYSDVTMPVNAPDMLAEGEFNRFYIRALCRRTIEEGKSIVRMYRAKSVSNPRPESEMLIGHLANAQQLLEDLRTNIGKNTNTGIPGGPNSGLSVELA
jgi:hypothetical protein